MTKKSDKHPLYIDMIKEALKTCTSRKGLSKIMIVKYIKANFEVGDNDKNINQIVKMTICRNVDLGKLVQLTGSGGSGSFRLPAAKKAAAAKAPAKAKKPAAKKPAAKKAAKKTAAKAKKPAKKAPAKVKTPAKKKAAAKKKK